MIYNIPDVSVIVPVYNAEETLEECINSILDPDFEECFLISVKLS